MSERYLQQSCDDAITIARLKTQLEKREDDYRQLMNRSDDQIEGLQRQLEDTIDWLKSYLDMPDGYRAIGFSDIQEMYNKLKENG